MIAIFIVLVLATLAFGIIVAVIGRGKYRWVALAAAMFALLTLVAAVVLLLGSGAVAIGTRGSVAQVLVVGCLAGTAIACVLCVIFGSIAIRERSRNAVA